MYSQEDLLAPEPIKLLHTSFMGMATAPTLISIRNRKTNPMLRKIKSNVFRLVVFNLISQKNTDDVVVPVRDEK
jgi:hypothetical protein